jgi:phosphoribosylanthranilate isomerase
MILVDSASPGSGTSYDLNLLRELPANVRLILSGGLTVDNVSMSIRAVSPWGVDVSSGVESAPGIKDHAKIRDFISSARSSIIRT